MSDAHKPARPSSLVEGYESGHCDGKPGFELYLSPLAFAWDGDPSSPIEVSEGGYGEPVKWLIDVTYVTGGPVTATAAGWLDWFRDRCERWLSE